MLTRIRFRNEQPSLASIRVTAKPTAEPLTIHEVRQQLVITGNIADAELVRLIKAARQWAEHFTGKALARQTIAVRYQWHTTPLRLYRPPFDALVSVTTFSEGEPTVEDKDAFYVIRPTAHNPELWLKSDGAFANPSAIEEIEVEYTAGYDGPSNTPDDVREALLLWIADRYDYRTSIREGTNVQMLEVTPESLLLPHRILA